MWRLFAKQHRQHMPPPCGTRALLPARSRSDSWPRGFKEAAALTTLGQLLGLLAGPASNFSTPVLSHRPSPENSLAIPSRPTWPPPPSLSPPSPSPLAEATLRAPAVESWSSGKGGGGVAMLWRWPSWRRRGDASLGRRLCGASAARETLGWRQKIDHANPQS